MEAQQIYTSMIQANDLMREAHYEEALEVLNSLDVDGELAGMVSFMKGCAYLQLEQDEQAHLCFGQALNQGLIHKQLYINFGIVKSRMGNVLQAEQMFRQAAELDPTDALPLNRILLLRLGRGDFDGAEAIMDELMERNPELVDGYHHKADLLLGTGRSEEALELLNGVEHRFSANPLYVYDRCRALRRVGRTEEALSYLDSRKEIFREDTELVLLKKQKASLLVDAKRYGEAVPLWRELYELYGDRQAGMALAAQALSENDMQTLLSIAEEMTATQTDDDSHYMCLYYKVLALRQLGDQEGMRDALRQAAEQFDALGDTPKGVKFRTLRATIYMEVGRYEEALHDLDSLIALVRQNADSAQRAHTLEELEGLKSEVRTRMNSFE